MENLFLYGAEVFGNQENFFKWLDSPNAALGGVPPREVLKTFKSVSEVRDILGRIAYGVHS